jgi:hypothetical protein
MNDAVVQAGRADDVETVGRSYQKLFGTLVDRKAGDLRDPQLAADHGRGFQERHVHVAACGQGVRSAQPSDPASDDDHFVHTVMQPARDHHAPHGGARTSGDAAGALALGCEHGQPPEAIEMAKRDAKIERLSHVPMFSACSKKDLEQVARLADELVIAEGKEIIREGEIGREFYVIMDGKAVVKRGGREISTLGPGDYFGELALLDGQKRDATVVAATPIEVLVIGVREFVSLLQDVPQLARKLLGGMARRLHELDAANR